MEHGICTDEDDLFDELALGFFLPGTEAPAEQLGTTAGWPQQPESEQQQGSFEAAAVPHQFQQHQHNKGYHERGSLVSPFSIKVSERPFSGPCQLFGTSSNQHHQHQQELGQAVPYSLPVRPISLPLPCTSNTSSQPSTSDGAASFWWGAAPAPAPAPAQPPPEQPVLQPLRSTHSVAVTTGIPTAEPHPVLPRRTSGPVASASASAASGALTFLQPQVNLPGLAAAPAPEVLTAAAAAAVVQPMASNSRPTQAPAGPGSQQGGASLDAILEPLANTYHLMTDLPPDRITDILERAQRRGKGGRQPAVDPRLDPSVDPKKAKRILANRQSAARSKMKQKLLVETLRTKQEVLSQQKSSTQEELEVLRRMCRDLQIKNQELESRLKVMAAQQGQPVASEQQQQQQPPQRQSPAYISYGGQAVEGRAAAAGSGPTLPLLSGAVQQGGGIILNQGCLTVFPGLTLVDGSGMDMQTS